MNATRSFNWSPALMAMVLTVGMITAVRAADADNGLPTQIVKFADLNVNTRSGAAILYRRLERAADKVCGGPLDVRELSRAVSTRECRQQAIERAVRTVNIGMLTKLHWAKTDRYTLRRQAAVNPTRRAEFGSRTSEWTRSRRI